MAKIYQKITDMVGSTPLLELSEYMACGGCRARLLAKLEYMNPAGYAKQGTSAAWKLAFPSRIPFTPVAGGYQAGL